MVEEEFTTEELAGEEWKSCDDFPDYAVSSLGRVRRETPGHCTWPGRLLNVRVGSTGYATVPLRREGHRRDAPVSVHHLVARAFLGEAPEGRGEVNHLDGNKCRNIPENIAWCSHQENMNHASQTGLMPTGARNGAHTHPERRPRGADHGMRAKPERAARGDKNAARKHPERVPRGALHGMSKITENDVRSIRVRIAAGERLQSIADDFHMTLQNIWQIKKRRTWKHVD